MEINFTYLTLFFLYSILIGVFIGLIYDVFRIIRIILSKNKFVIFAEDIIFCMLTALIMAVFIFNAGYGQTRLFAFFGSAGGFSAYYFSVGKLVYRCSEIIIAFIKKLLKKTIKIICAPFKAIAKKIVVLFNILKKRYIFFRSLRKSLRMAARGFDFNIA